MNRAHRFGIATIGIFSLLSLPNLLAGGNSSDTVDRIPDLEQFPLYFMRVSDATLTKLEKGSVAPFNATVANLRDGYNRAHGAGFQELGFFWISADMLCKLYGVKSEFVLHAAQSFVTMAGCNSDEIDQMLGGMRELMYEIEGADGEHMVTLADWVSGVAEIVADAESRERIADLTAAVNESNMRATRAEQRAEELKAALIDVHAVLEEAQIADGEPDSAGMRFGDSFSGAFAEVVLVQADLTQTFGRQSPWQEIVTPPTVDALVAVLEEALATINKVLEDESEAARAAAAATLQDFYAKMPHGVPAGKMAIDARWLDVKLLSFDDATVHLAGPDSIYVTSIVYDRNRYAALLKYIGGTAMKLETIFVLGGNLIPDSVELSEVGISLTGNDTVTVSNVDIDGKIYSGDIQYVGDGILHVRDIRREAPTAEDEESDRQDAASDIEIHETSVRHGVDVLQRENESLRKVVEMQFQQISALEETLASLLRETAASSSKIGRFVAQAEADTTEKRGDGR